MRGWRIIGIGAICVGVLAAGSATIKLAMVRSSTRRFRIAAKNFISVRVGDSREEVISSLGEPNYHDGECEEVFGPPKDCTNKLIYSDPYDLLLGNFYIVDFSAQGRVIATKHIH
jgi:hypothetical protein